jgi:L-lactate dehydrogenase (cytochrome)
VASNRENERRAGFAVPLRPSGMLLADGLLHPRWLLGNVGYTLLRSGMPRFENLTAQRGQPIIARPSAPDHRAGRDALAWPDMQWLRDTWPGRLVLKGLLHPGDVARAHALGADGVILSNHGGRQLDHAIAPMAVLPAAVRAAKSMDVMVDSGFRRGTDVLKALALGAKLVFVGRPMMYGAAVGGQAGVARALAILRREIDIAMALCGCSTVSQIDAGLLIDNAAPADRALTPQ